MRLLRAVFLFVCAIGLLSLAGFVLVGSPLAPAAAVAGLGSIGLALA
jgi:hypothetical protein